MSVLGFDTATAVCSVALATYDKLLAEITVNTRKNHSERLMPYIAQLLEMTAIKKDELTAVAVSIGPGSFTGLRIGLATAKSLAYALKIPLFGIPTLEALAFNCPLPNVILSPMIDAQKGNVYQGVYSWQSGKLTTLVSTRVIPFTEAIAQLGASGKPVTILGEGADLYKKSGQTYDNVLLPSPHIGLSRASSVAILGAQKLKQGDDSELTILEPVYIRRSAAEELWEQCHGGQNV